VSTSLGVAIRNWLLDAQNESARCGARTGPLKVGGLASDSICLVDGQEHDEHCRLDVPPMISFAIGVQSIENLSPSFNPTPASGNIGSVTHTDFHGPLTTRVGNVDYMYEQ
jgi:hypothetical protein